MSQVHMTSALQTPSKPDKVMRALRSMSQAAMRPPSPDPVSGEVCKVPTQHADDDLLLPEHLLQAASMVLKSQDELMNAIIQLGTKQSSLPSDLDKELHSPVTPEERAEAEGEAEGEFKTLLNDLDMTEGEWAEWQMDMKRDGYSQGQIDGMRAELTSVRQMVSNLYVKQLRLNTRINKLLATKEAPRLSPGLNPVQGGGVPDPASMMVAVQAAVESVATAVQAVEEVAPEKVSPTLRQASEMQGGGAQAPCTDSADSAEAAAKAAGRVRKGGPLNEVRHNLFGALEIAHKSIMGFLSPRSQSLYLAGEDDSIKDRLDSSRDEAADFKADFPGAMSGRSAIPAPTTGSSVTPGDNSPEPVSEAQDRNAWVEFAVSPAKDTVQDKQSLKNKAYEDYAAAEKSPQSKERRGLFGLRKFNFPRKESFANICL